MEQITKKDGVFYYGDQKCDNVEDAYLRFRREYHDSIGRKAFRRLDRLGQRRERIHGFGFCFPEDDPIHRLSFSLPRRRCELLGLVGIHYFWMIHLSDLHDLTEKEFDDYLDWALRKGSKALIFSGRRKKLGRTSKNLRKRFK